LSREVITRRGRFIDLEAASREAEAEELRVGLGRESNALLAGEHPLLR
jgi:hypothetical protein